MQVRIGHMHRFSFFSCWYILMYIFVHYHYRCHIKTIFLLYFFTLFNITSLIRSFINHQLSGEWDNFAKLRWTNNRQIIYIIINYSKYIDTQGTWLINKYKTHFYHHKVSIFVVRINETIWKIYMTIKIYQIALNCLI